jgi:hypothetical protein
MFAGGTMRKKTGVGSVFVVCCICAQTMIMSGCKATDGKISWKTDIESKLANHEVSFEFVKAPLFDVMSFLQKEGDVNIIIDPQANESGVDRNITLRLSKAKLGLALEWVCRLADLEYKLRNGAIIVSTHH